ncbi:AzlD domain-containing protein [Marinomonas piezotolerans]|uniref:AzlD domain-containing protein n=1 Tax=Marinomonas piezotolerans TaxID=2213058 RepID=A0A370UC13_9GAMM|nr:AzlD domain-containing protein [Marinomonas piezotolerans]RDL45314.1 AzlD domain-containing protein [Marinomonas piezotolerans]
MSGHTWMILLSIALGTYLIRTLPYLWMSRKLNKQAAQGGVGSTPVWLTILGPTMIAAMFGTSLVPVEPSFFSWIATAVGCVATYLMWRRTRSMGYPIVVGVLVFGALIVLFG